MIENADEALFRREVDKLTDVRRQEIEGAKYEQTEYSLEFLETGARKVAELMLTDLPWVRRVALFGSSAREKPFPSDLDIIVLVDENTACDIKQYAGEVIYTFDEDGNFGISRLAREGSTSEGDHRSFYISPETLLQLKNCMVRSDGTSILNQVYFFPEASSDAYYKDEIRGLSDPYFIANLSEDYKEYDQASGTFIKRDPPWQNRLSHMRELADSEMHGRLL